MHPRRTTQNKKQKKQKCANTCANLLKSENTPWKPPKKTNDWRAPGAPTPGKKPSQKTICRKLATKNRQAPLAQARKAGKLENVTPGKKPRNHAKKKTKTSTHRPPLAKRLTLGVLSPSAVSGVDRAWSGISASTFLAHSGVWVFGRHCHCPLLHRHCHGP